MYPIIERVFDAIIRVDEKLDIKFVSDNGLRWFGSSALNFAKNLNDLTIEEDRHIVETAIAGTPKSFNCYVRLYRKDNVPAWVNLRASLTPFINQYVICILNVDDFNYVDANLLHAAEHDSLTGLPNRALLTKTINSLINSEHGSFSVALMDLDGFKKVNDTLGHHSGDAVLVETSKRLSRLIDPERDLIARLGGDEFVIILDDAGNQDRINRIMSNILYSVSRSYSVDKGEAYLGCSIGLVNYPEHADSYTNLLKNADVAMYLSKKRGKNRVTTFEQLTQNEDFAIKTALHVGIQEGEFYLEYQPLYDTSGSVIGTEALMRWNSQDFGKLSPAVFIPIAEETGLMNFLGDWALRSACFQLKEFQTLVPSFTMSVNVSPVQFCDDNFYDNVLMAIEDSGIDPTKLTLEITESTLMKNIENIEKILLKLTEKGISFSIDDFGTGFSSISYLTRLPVRALKIDKSFIKAIENQSNLKDTAEKKLIKAMVQLSHSVNLQCVAEGIETVDQLENLRGVGCDFFQGFLLSKPISSVDIIKLLKRKK